MKKLHGVPLVYDMMTVPFYCWGVCYLMKNDVPVQEFGQTYTALFTNLLALFVRNHGLRNPSMKITKVLNIPIFKEICIDLAELAYQMKVSGKIFIV